MKLQALLSWLASGGGAGVVTYYIIRETLLETLEPKPKRYVAIGLSFVLACLAFTGLVALGYAEPMGSAQAWVEKLFLVGTSAFGLSQIIHAQELGD
jgi:hypothetical protein